MAKILVVDDRAVSREFLVTLLGYYHHHLLEAADGVEALKVLTTQHPDLIITDILMPNMGGYELVKKLQADPQFIDIPVIFYTAIYRVGDAALLAVNCGVKHVLSKPSDPQLILDTVNKVLNELKVSREVGKSLESSVHQKIFTADEDGIKIQAKMSEYKANIEQTEKSLTTLLNCGEAAVLEIDRKKLVKLTEAFSQNAHSLIGINVRLLTLFELNIDLRAQHDPMKLIQLFSKGAHKIIGASYCVLGILNDDHTKLSYYLEISKNNLFQKDVDLKAYECGFINQILESRMAVKINDPHQQASHYLPLNHPVRNCLFGLPVIVNGHLYGFLYFADTVTGNKFTAVDFEMAAALAAQFSILFENTELKSQQILPR